MKEYHKIQTVFLRDPNTNFKTLLEGQWSYPEFEYLKNNEWIWTEKIDGTNIRVMWDGTTVTFGGKTDNAEIPKHLRQVLEKIFTPLKMGIAFGTEPKEVCLYGEGYGAKIQKGGGNYLSNRCDFILFDCYIDGWWLRRDQIEDIAHLLNINTVPVVGVGSLVLAVEYCRNKFPSLISENQDFVAEGLVMRPKVELFTRSGCRVITKIKCKDFAK